MHNWGTSVKNEKNLEAWTHPALTWTLLSESFMPRWRIFTMGSKSSVALQVLFIGLVLLTQEMPGSRDGTIAGKRRIWYPGSSAQCFLFQSVFSSALPPRLFLPLILTTVETTTLNAWNILKLCQIKRKLVSFQMCFSWVYPAWEERYAILSGKMSECFFFIIFDTNLCFIGSNLRSMRQGERWRVATGPNDA